MEKGLIPVKGNGGGALSPFSHSGPPASVPPVSGLPLTPLSGSASPFTPPPMEAGKDVKLIMVLAAGFGAMFYSSRVAGGGKEMKRLTRDGGAALFTFPALILILVAVIAGVLLWSGAHAQTIHCNLCGAEVKEWTDIDMEQKFSSLPAMIKSVIMGSRMPTIHYGICQGCRERFNSLLTLTQSQEFEAVLKSFAGGGNG